MDERPHFTLRPRSPSLSAAPQSRGRRAHLIAGERCRRDDLARRPGRDVRERDLRVLLEHPLARLERRPRHRDADAADPAPEEDAHLHVGSALEADRLQRQPDLDGVACVGEPARAVPDPVGRGVFPAGRRVEHVELDAAGIDHQVVGHLPGAKRIEAEADPVVAPDIVAPGDRGLDPRRFRIVAAEREIERVAVVADPHRGLLRDGVAMQGVVGQPFVGRQRRTGPGLVVQRAVDDRRRAEPRRPKRRQPRRRRRHLSRGNGRDECAGKKTRRTPVNRPECERIECVRRIAAGGLHAGQQFPVPVASFQLPVTSRQFPVTGCQRSAVLTGNWILGTAYFPCNTLT